MLRENLQKKCRKNAKYAERKCQENKGIENNKNGGKQTGNNKRKAHFKTFSFQITCRFNLCDSTERRKRRGEWGGGLREIHT